jgi:hypothetical protein
MVSPSLGDGLVYWLPDELAATALNIAPVDLLADPAELGVGGQIKHARGVGAKQEGIYPVLNP